MNIGVNEQFQFAEHRLEKKCIPTAHQAGSAYLGYQHELTGVISQVDDWAKEVIAWTTPNWGFTPGAENPDNHAYRQNKYPLIVESSRDSVRREVKLYNKEMLSIAKALQVHVVDIAALVEKYGALKGMTYTDGYHHSPLMFELYIRAFATYSKAALGMLPTESDATHQSAMRLLLDYTLDKTPTTDIMDLIKEIDRELSEKSPQQCDTDIDLINSLTASSSSASKPVIPFNTLKTAIDTFIDSFFNSITRYTAGVVEDCPSYFPPGNNTYWSLPTNSRLHSNSLFFAAGNSTELLSSYEIPRLG